MKPTTILVLVWALAGLAACGETGAYPLTGEACGPDDPVLDMNPATCTPPG